MPHFIRVLLLLLLAALSQPTLAAERELLGTDGPAGIAAELSAAAESNGRVKVIVGLRVPFAPTGDLAPDELRVQQSQLVAARSGLKARFADTIARNPGGFRGFGPIPFVAMEVTPQELRRLATDPAVLSVSENRLFAPTLLRSAPQVRAPAAWAVGARGTGQTIAIIDTGVDSTHPFLKDKVVAEACFSVGRWCPDEQQQAFGKDAGLPCPGDCGHGTHVAGIAAGSSALMSGIAPDANIIAIQVFSPTNIGPRAYLSDILAGLRYVYQMRNTFRIAAVNLSLGGGHFTSPCDRRDPAMTAMIRQLRSAGIATVISSGNDGYTDGINSPACISSAISVGAVSSYDWGTCWGSPAAADKVGCFSNTARFLTLLAPGAFITSSVPGGGYADFVGTSMAAPHVAGAIADLRQKAPYATVQDIVTALTMTGPRIADYRVPAISKTRIDVKAALDLLLAMAGDGKVPVSLRMGGRGHGTVNITGPDGTRLSCTGACTTFHHPGAVITLSAAPDAGTSFTGWSGACSGTATCIVTLNAAQDVTAQFSDLPTPTAQLLSLATAGSGSGTIEVVANGVTLDMKDQPLAVMPGSAVQLTARPAEGSVLAGWSGGCKGVKEVCVVWMRGNTQVTASFMPQPMARLAYTKSGSAAGRVAIQVVGGASTTEEAIKLLSFPVGTELWLTALPGAGASFDGWSGLCRGVKRMCRAVLTADATLTGRFR